MSEQTRAKEQSGHDEEDLTDLHQELRVLLQGAQVLTAFLVVLPFNQGFEKLNEIEKWVYLVTFLCSLASLILFSAPAAHHRLIRPLMNRVKFKDFATRMVILGLVPASIALVLATQLVVSAVMSDVISLIAASLVAVMIAVLWWVLPLLHRDELRKPPKR